MDNIDTFSDPRRTITAGRLYGKVHVTRKVKVPDREGISAYHPWGFQTACGQPIATRDLMLLLQRPEDITCLRCRMIMLKESAP